MTVAKVIARAWADADYKSRLLNDPAATLAEAGVKLPPGITIKVVENTADTQHMVLPASPTDAGKISTDELETVAAGMCNYTIPASGW